LQGLYDQGADVDRIDRLIRTGRVAAPAVQGQLELVAAAHGRIGLDEYFAFGETGAVVIAENRIDVV